MKDQMPGDGCQNCGKWAREPQHILRKRLRRASDSWLCYGCRKDEAKRQGVKLRELK
jgi:hypothetical protein